MNTQDFSLINGFPLNQAALARMQTAYSIFNALGSIVGDKTIISGCNVVGANTTNGVVYLNGEVFEFRGGSTQSKVIIKEDVTNLVYKNNNSYPVVKTRYVTFGAGVGAIDWVDFKRGFDTKDIAAGLAGKADQNSFEALADAFVLVYAKMLTIEEGAQKNVQADLAQTDPEAADFVKNQGNYVEILRSGTLAIGNPSGSSLLTVNFEALPNSNYTVLPTLISLGDPANDISVSYIIREKTNNSFKVYVRESGNITQNLALEWTLIPKS